MAKKSVTLNKAFKEYRFKYLPNHPFFCDELTLFTGICTEYNDLMSKLVVEQGYTKETKHGLGSHFIGKFKLTKKKQIDFGHFRKTGEIKYHDNMHTNSNVGRWVWRKSTLKVRNAELYDFRATRTNKRFLSETIQREGIDIYRDSKPKGEK